MRMDKVLADSDENVKAIGKMRKHNSNMEKLVSVGELKTENVLVHEKEKVNMQAISKGMDGTWEAIAIQM